MAYLLDTRILWEKSCMPRTKLRREIKKAIDRIPEDRLESLADYVAFLNRPSLKEQVEEAERAFTAGKGIDWRKVRSDV